MRRRSLAVLGGLMMATGALRVVAPASLGVAPAPTTVRFRFGAARPVPIRSLTAPVPRRPAVPAAAPAAGL
ncbi:hypothetical protein [Actinomadura napierensis]|uniref:Uncharacterized protein n=1 Tax=Actinomadura napierensis TaxID=267854 RepID=A0ABP5L737_9ACTN